MLFNVFDRIHLLLELSLQIWIRVHIHLWEWTSYSLMILVLLVLLLSLNHVEISWSSKHKSFLDLVIQLIVCLIRMLIIFTNLFFVETFLFKIIKILNYILKWRLYTEIRTWVVMLISWYSLIWSYVCGHSSLKILRAHWT